MPMLLNRSWNRRNSDVIVSWQPEKRLKEASALDETRAEVLVLAGDFTESYGKYTAGSGERPFLNFLLT